MRLKKQIPWRSIAVTLLAALLGAALGYWVMSQTAPLGLLGVLGGAALLVLAYLLQILVHEGGHLVCGLLTGYRMLSFRIGRLLLVKLNGHWRLRSYHIPGTGGQCLMAPPAQEHPPYRLYHLGGGLANLLLSLLALPVLSLSSAPLLRVFAGALALTGAWFAGSNLIPMKSGGVANDGYNACYQGRDPLALWCSCSQLWMVEAFLEGYSIGDMPEEWFLLPPKADLNNPLILGTAIQGASRLLARGETEAADQTIRRLLTGGYDLLGLHRLELTGEAIYCALVLGRPQEARRLYTPEVQRYWRQTLRYSPSRVRQAYAWALLMEGDLAQAQTIRAEFDRVAARYPYPGEIPGERRLLSMADQAFRSSAGLPPSSPAAGDSS